ncbi:hypothetical protein [Agrobacterium rubi]|uniref:Uncharacterized protein n=1 Tax=Agrobacterium rubi TaxID=28099 RepID=A0AAE7R7I5_9HYPH|nr:hypothetical protein [Agrobacterium rubi]NTE85778.1 hypothetical protein [Agrobacterium rubi]NTF01710.1 hypothetical protein [Agrobacterium rubi]NTF35953.1 hypothetical protein [Agrobacterium rubi]QTG01052.1 hypothetical protein G6M88_11915 [Agrobacterium rubi]
MGTDAIIRQRHDNVLIGRRPYLEHHRRHQNGQKRQLAISIMQGMDPVRPENLVYAAASSCNDTMKAKPFFR